MPTSESSRPTSHLAALSILAAPLAWAVVYASGRASGATFSETAANRMILLLWVAAAITAAGLILGILAVRNRGTSRLLAILGLVLNSVSAAFMLILGLIWLGLSL